MLASSLMKIRFCHWPFCQQTVLSLELSSLNRLLDSPVLGFVLHEVILRRYVRKKILMRCTNYKHILPNSFSTALVTAWLTWSPGKFTDWKQSSAITTLLGLRWGANGTCSSTCPTRRNILGSLANHPAVNQIHYKLNIEHQIKQHMAFNLLFCKIHVHLNYIPDLTIAIENVHRQKWYFNPTSLPLSTLSPEFNGPSQTAPWVGRGGCFSLGCPLRSEHKEQLTRV